MTIRKTLALGWLCLASTAGISQVPDQEVVLKAMQDELNRNLNELKGAGVDKPFFIMYGMREQKSIVLSATLGSILQTGEHTRRLRTTTRVLVGDYGFNDESLEDDLTSGPTAMDLALPITDDYNGIRRSYWSITDNVYREAARHYKQHQEALKELGKPLKDLPHREFAKSQPVHMIGTLAPATLDRAAWEQRLRNLSAKFLSAPSIKNSLVFFNLAQGYDYLVSSEGSVIKVPFQHCTYSAIIQGKDAQGAPTFEQIVHNARTPDQLPAESQLAAEIDQLLTTLSSRSGATLPEAYSGPVLFLGPAVASVLFRGALGARDGLRASDYIPTSKGFQFGEDDGAMDSKIGRNLLHESLTIKARPHLKSFEGTELLGSFDVDDEGIVPPDELVLVEKGVLKNLMNNRTLTHPTQTANGFGQGPGVLDVSTTFKDTEASLKEKLIAQAKKEGLEFALIVRGSPLMGMGPMSVYKINLTDGKEELVRNAILSERNSRMLRRVIGATGTRMAYNIGGGEQLGEIGAGAVTSCIVPTALLLEEVDIQSFRMPWQKETEYVASPIGGR